MKHSFSNMKFDDVKMIYVLAALVTGAAVLLLAWFGVLYVRGMSSAGDIIIPEEVVKEEEIDNTCKKNRHPLTGICLTEEAPEQVYAVMVENHPDARPQSGIAKADIVYEAPVEANYSRFMLLFTNQSEASKIGPVRSARPYYLDWAQEYGDLMYVHVGGSPAALERITNEGMNDLNEFFRGWYFWRSEDRFAPHNVYTSSKLIGRALEQYSDQYQDKTFPSWTYQEAEGCTETCVEEVVVTFLGTTYQAVWKYDAENEYYVRYQDGFPHKDQDGTNIIADTLVVQRVETTVIDSIGRISMETIGSGEVLLFAKGILTEGRWEKDAVEERTRWVDESGKDISLNPGKIWVEVLNQRGDITFE